MKQIPKRKPKQKPKQIGDKGERGKRGLRSAEPMAPPAPALSDRSPAPPAAPPPSSLPVPDNKRPVEGTQPLSPNQLEVVMDGSRPIADLLAESAMSPLVLNALVAMNFTRPQMAKADMDASGINAFVKVLKSRADAIVKGDMAGVETTLAAQIVSLDAITTDLMLRSQRNMGQYLPAAETYMRLALKAQAQCRATAEALAEIKNPRPVFAKNFNAVSGNQQVNQTTGHQQVNNAPAPKSITHEPE